VCVCVCVCARALQKSKMCFAGLERGKGVVDSKKQEEEEEKAYNAVNREVDSEEDQRVDEMSFPVQDNKMLEKQNRSCVA